MIRHMRHWLARLICPEIFAALDTVKAALRAKTANCEYLSGQVVAMEDQRARAAFESSIMPKPRRITVEDLRNNVWN